MAVRPIDANAMLNELRPVSFEAEHSAVLLSDVSKMMREWVERQPTLTPPNEALPVLVDDEPDREYIDYICPRCKYTISQRRRGQRMETVYQCKYHDNCGQRVDWSNPQPDRRPPEAKDNNVPTDESLTLEQLRASPHGKIKDSTLQSICNRANEIARRPPEGGDT